ncbi:integrase [Endozoicomonas montiporae]|uniref:Integrase n=2 Tax=Endozoicomonas montiporae TaxID=1027273 RepID=A0A081N7P7_9GAMM|nr:site-specific integrase [Endozoicomonas montiporae]AMO55677.1 phage integrase family protein [Endozoicomonas montiporae CL-33]KEQ14470.1 integrase [Endozoicomonas montiporae]
MAITDTWLKANNGKKRDKRDEVADRDGLSVRVTPQGKIVFQIRYRYAGKPKRLDIGSYPLITLKEAREENTRLRRKLEQGHDPAVVRQLEKQAIITATTLENLYRLWYKSYCKKSKQSHIEINRSFEIHILPKIGHLPAKQVTTMDWLNILEKLVETIPAIAERILVNAKQMLNWAVTRHIIDTNPLAAINAKADLQIKKGVIKRSLSDSEIRQVWEAIHKSRMSHKNKLFLILCLVFGCRNGELRKSKKSGFDLDNMIWTVPPSDHKLGSSTGMPLIRPIIPEIKPLIEQAVQLSKDSSYVFTNSGSNKMMGKSSPLPLPYNIMQWLRKNKDIEMEHWSVHDLRKTARTKWSTLTAPHVAEIMLGHKLPGEWQTYDQHLYIDEQAEAYSKWWCRLMQISENIDGIDRPIWQ